MHQTSVLILTIVITERVVMFAKIYGHLNIPFKVIYSDDPYELEIDLPKISLLRTENPQASVLLLDSVEYWFIHYFAFGPDLLGYHLLTARKSYIYDYKDILSQTDLNIDASFRTLEQYVLLSARMITSRDPRAHKFFESCGYSEHFGKICIIPDYCIFDKNSVAPKMLYRNELKLVTTGGCASEEKYGQDAAGISIVINKLLENPLVTIEIIGGYSAAQRSPSVPLLEDCNNSRVTFVPFMTPRRFFSKLSSYDMAIHAFNGDYIDTEQDNHNCFFNQLNKISSSSRLLTYAAAALPIIHGNQNSFNYRFLRDKSVLITCPLDELNRNIDEFVRNPTGFVVAELASRNASYRKGTDFVRLFLKVYLERYHSCRLYSDAIQAAIETIV